MTSVQVLILLLCLLETKATYHKGFDISHLRNLAQLKLNVFIEIHH